MGDQFERLRVERVAAVVLYLDGLVAGPPAARAGVGGRTEGHLGRTWPVVGPWRASRFQDVRADERCDRGGDDERRGDCGDCLAFARPSPVVTPVVLLRFVVPLAASSRHELRV
ncbi:hypothetical protein [Halorubellus sp. PRR65]|uniref:hypothetical protein n=1 Tax=Halorubellus sp. PRR65 TaxID=3098148 RepID=UPI002B25B7FF|nr:hypothetical protein [Halorubellus sp. PRR65]